MKQLFELMFSNTLFVIIGILAFLLVLMILFKLIQTLIFLLKINKNVRKIERYTDPIKNQTNKQRKARPNKRLK